MNIEIIESQIGYTFINKTLLKTALTHSSATNETGGENNQRLEFLGDAVLQLIISDILYARQPTKQEGFLSKKRAFIVCADSLYAASEKINLKDLIILGKSEEISGGRYKKNIIADCVESIIAAVYLDSGYESASCFVRTLLSDIINEALSGQSSYDHKTMLQEYVQSNSLGVLFYQLIDSVGPDHDPTFYSSAVIGGRVYPKGEGHSKKESEQQAALNAYNALTEKVVGYNNTEKN